MRSVIDYVRCHPVLAVVLVILVLMSVASRADAQEQRASVAPLALSMHLSNYRASNRSEIASNFVGGGVAVKWKGFELDAALGVQQLKGTCEFCGTMPGGYLGMRWSPRR